MPRPKYKVEIAFNAGYTTPAASRVWTDVSAYVEGDQPLTISRGRSDEIGQIEASRLTLTLDNTDGRFTPEKSSGAYYPNIKKSRPIRVTATVGESPAADYQRFLGYIDEWPLAWPEATGNKALVTIAATSRRARLGRSSELRSIVEEEYLLDDPVGYYTLGDPATSVSASESSGRGRPPLTQVGSGAAVSFGSGIGPGTDGLPAIMLAGGKYLAVSSSGLGGGGSAGWLEAFFVGSTDWTKDQLVVQLGESTATPVRIYARGGNGQVRADYGDALSIGTGGPVLADGLLHHVALTWPAGSSGSARLYVDGVEVSTGAFTAAPPTASRLFVGGSTDPDQAYAMLGTVAHVACGTTQLTAGRVADHSESGHTGFAGESSGDRVGRYASYAGVPAGEYIATGSISTVDHVDTTGKSPVELIDSVTATENGVFFDSTGGSAVFFGRATRYNASSSFTLDAATDQVQADLEPKLDDQFLVNDCTATGTDGSAARATDAASLDAYGAYRETIDLLTDDPNELAAAAQWRVGLGKEPRLRYATVTVDVTNAPDAVAHAVAPADIGWRFGLSNLPTQAPSSTADLFIEGYTETLTATSHSIAFNTSPTYGYAGTVGVWQLDVNSLDGPAVLAY